MDKGTAVGLMILAFVLGLIFSYVVIVVTAPRAFIPTGYKNTCQLAGFDAPVVDAYHNLLCINYKDTEPYFVYYQPVIDEALEGDK